MDWGLAGQISGVGFSLVFVILVILAVITWLVGKVINRLEADKSATDNQEKGA